MLVLSEKFELIYPSSLSQNCKKKKSIFLQLLKKNWTVETFQNRKNTNAYGFYQLIKYIDKEIRFKQKVFLCRIKDSVPLKSQSIPSFVTAFFRVLCDTVLL